MRNFLVILIVNIHFYSWAQEFNIDLTLDEMPNEWIKLAVYKGIDSEILDSTKLDFNGKGILKYNTSFTGLGFLISEKNKVLSIVLNLEHIKLVGKTIENSENIICLDGTENKNYINYINTFPKYQQANMAWDFLGSLYHKNPTNKSEQKVYKQIKKEQQRIAKFEDRFYKDLNPNSFVAQYIPWYKLINSSNYIVQNKPQEIPNLLANLQAIDLTNDYFYNSGLLQNYFEILINLILKHYGNNERAIAEIRISIDYILNNLLQDEKKLNVIADYLFEKLEQKSLIEASEYLSLQLLNQNACKLSEGLTKQLETYRKMKVGNKAPLIEFTGSTFRNNLEVSDVWLNSKFTLVIFGASWCPGCNELMPILANNYFKWQKKGMEMIFISLDTDSIDFKSYAQKLPFISTCDFKKWNGENVTNYYVFATPTMYILDEENTILFRPQHPKQIDDWLKKQNL